MKHLFLLSTLLLILACNASEAVHLESLQDTTKPSVAQELEGLSTQRLLHINTAMDRFISTNKLAGTVTLVARNGNVVHLAAQGMQDREAQIPMSRDSIFRIYSMTKPITAVAALTLWEQGKFHMNDPITKYLPELSNLKVYVSGEGEDMVLEDAKYPIRILDLFLHTAGFSYGFTGSEVDKLYRASPLTVGTVTPDTLLTELAKLPLNHQPGTKWHYGANIDVIGVLVERISGQKLGEYMHQHIFEPLDMQDTGFYVKPENVGRLAQIYGPNDMGQTIVVQNVPLGDYKSDPAIHNGGGGLVSTVDDYFVFAQMLLNGGEYKGTRILGRKTVEYMTSNHLPSNMLPFAPDAQGEGYALAMSVTVDKDQLGFMGSNGNYGWSGLASTYFRIDPQENMIIISMAQFLPNQFHPYQDDFRNTVYQALVD